MSDYLARFQARRERLLAAGLCSNCGDEPLVTSLYGAACLERRRLKDRQRNYAEENRTRAERPQPRLRVLPKPHAVIQPTPISAKVYVPPLGSIALAILGRDRTFNTGNGR